MTTRWRAASATVPALTVALVLTFALDTRGTAPLVADEGVGLSRYVDPLIGSDGHGHVFVGASVPFGGVQLGPSNPHRGWDWCSGYHYSDNVLLGFSHLHLSGTGIADLGDILLMPHAGESPSVGADGNPASEYKSRYSHEHEVSRPGYYAVDLLDFQIRAELTATERVGFHRYTYPAGRQARLIVDLGRGNNDRTTEASIDQRDDRTLVGRRYSTGWAADQRVFFAMETSAPASAIEFQDETGRPSDGAEDASRAVLLFPPGTRELLVKVGLSPVSTQNAQLNIEAEVPHWDFRRTSDQAKRDWDEALGSIRVRMDDESQMRVFYTALYHTMIAPFIFNDVNGDYRGADHTARRAADHVNYTVFSLWDSYRAASPLITITQPHRVNDIVASMLAIYDEQGKLPVWHLMGNETDTMIGYHAVPVIADAFLKGFRGFDVEKAYKAVKDSAAGDSSDLVQLRERGYIPADLEQESVAKGLEYAIDDWCIEQMAREMQRDEDALRFSERSMLYRNYFDPDVGFMRGKLSDGSWRAPFDPVVSTHRQDDYCEGNAWQYTWLAPHDTDGLVELLGGNAPFLRKLDELFRVEAEMGEAASADISGLIGQYAHGNEPGHHVPYLYVSAGAPWKTAERVRQIMTTMYNDTPAGLCGNDDCGQLSAWYVFSSLGFYPVQPAGGQYVLGSPLVRSATIRLPDGGSFQIKAINNSKKNIYIKTAELNGLPLDGLRITHRQITAGGELVLEMTDSPSDSIGFPGPVSASASR